METTETQQTTAYDTDPTGEAAIWEAASRMAREAEVSEGMPDDAHGYWNAAVTQIARDLEKKGREIRQKNGMYYRVLNGEHMPT